MPSRLESVIQNMAKKWRSKGYSDELIETSLKMADKFIESMSK